ncbi:hypothetical protein EVG20_g5868 [Dentipellis fragilis]|uniref:Post-SET domain-containing protein n=1 Tax=Dentipellis fragilis TaxID=205917 RepID=A0A4Y9YSD8_9AGAM|nr:hypothetical protein EVG20_g5868 [Dentipellis fragilis]
MENTGMQSMTSTLATQPSQDPAPQQQQQQQPQAQQVQPPTDGSASAPPTIPVKRGPGRPKGSGVKAKFIDPNAPITPKRPVGRPRKDGLPAGSVPRAPPSRKRKIAAPGTFAVLPDGQQQHLQDAQQHHGASASAPMFATVGPNHEGYPYPPWPVMTAYSTLSAALQSEPPPPPRRESVVSVPPHGPTVDPALSQDEQWTGLDVLALLQQIVVALHMQNPVSRAGLSAEDAFRFHVATLAPKPGTPPPIPALYSILKTFWLPTSPAYFSLTASSSTTPTPSEHRFFYWDPQPLVFNGIACPFCTTPLVNRGCIRSGPVKVYDVGAPYFVIGCEYACVSPPCRAAVHSGEGRKFSSTDRAVMRALPLTLRDELAVVMLPEVADGGTGWNWQALGVSRALWALITSALAAGLEKDAVLQIVRSTQDAAPVQSMAIQKVEDEERMEAVSDEQSQADQAQDQGQDQQQEGEAARDTAAAAAYNDAWKAHSATGDAPSQPAPPSASAPGPAPVPAPEASTSAVATVTPAPAPVQAQAQYAYPQLGPYVPYPYGPYPPPFYGGEPGGALKRNGESLSAEPPAKRIRHCVKCGSKECKGKGGRGFCTNACQDCGKLECKGRNSKRPDKTCVDAWA